MHVFDLYNEIYKGNIDKLPEEIIVSGMAFYKHKYRKDYYAVPVASGEQTVPVASGEQRLIDDLEAILKIDTEDILQLPVIMPKKEGKWKPKKDEKYWHVNLNGEVDDYLWNYDNADNFIYNIGNCFKTKEEAQKHLDNIETEIELRKLAEELNNGEKIDWKDKSQWKCCLYYDYEYNSIGESYTQVQKNPRVIYCIGKCFMKKAIKKIGKERLEKYLKEM